ncbi:hypothetical protein [Streptomyces sp. CBMA156]|uniref:hypothetical protein n=1 Tax=Streptomyces sp. CBMA156 TaxID=1930280 RepID=UPI001661AAB8|nr:hypothetical protein [Streptomyces sp. CBMA156]MBD0671493.1 hypothetical protein [Streptomyces sp. CBMA156]
MSGDTTNITVAYLEGRLADLRSFEQDVNDQKVAWLKAPAALKAGQDSFPSAKALKQAYVEYAKSVGDGIEAVRKTIDDIVNDLLKAGRTLHEGDGEALSEAQMLEILHDVLGGVAPKSTLP